jgi:predicted HTH transcriptional regulator
VVLKSGTRWVDRRFLTFPYHRDTESGIEWVVDPMTRLESLISGRERIGVEFKREVPREDKSKLRMMKTVAAFANEKGGSVLVGVSDDRELIGIPRAEAAKATDALTEMVCRWVTPTPPHSIDDLPLGEDGERVVLELVISEGTHIYGAGKPNETPTVYVRPYSTTEKAWPSEIEDIVGNRQNGQSSGWLPRGPFV